MIPLRLTPLSVAAPELFVILVPAAVPLRVKLIVFPLSPDPPEVSVAVKLAVLPDVPEPLTPLIVVGAGLGAVVTLEVVVTSNASSCIQDPWALAFLRPVGPIPTVCGPTVKPDTV